MKVEGETNQVLKDSSTNWSFIEPSCRENAIVPDEFRNKVVAHIIKNQLQNITSPLMLAIQGPRGEGKSYQVREVCSQMGVYVIPISGAFLSGSLEKAALDILADAYVYASSLQDVVKRMVALVIDDFDLSVASTFDDVKYTVNSQLLTGFLMNLADDPSRCGKVKTHRIPIIVTGNNFKALASPLTRHGRMNFFDWVPTIDNKLSMLIPILSPIVSNKDAQGIRLLVESFGNQPVSFFVMLIDDLLDEIIITQILQNGSTRVASIEKAVSQKLSGQVDIGELVRLAEARVANNNPHNYPE